MTWTRIPAPFSRHHVVIKRRVPTYAPYVFALIAHCCPGIENTCHLVTHTAVKHVMKKKKIIQESDEEAEDEEEAPTSKNLRSRVVETSKPKKTKGEGKVMKFLCSIFFLQKDMHAKQYDDHVRHKKNTKMLKDSLRKQGEDISHGFESEITPFVRYRSQFYDVEFGDEATSSRAPGQGHDDEDDDDEGGYNDEDYEGEEEEEEEEEDEES